MSEIRDAFDAGNYALVRRLAEKRPSAEAEQLMARIQTDPKIIWAGLFALVFALVVAVYALELIR